MTILSAVLVFLAGVLATALYFKRSSQGLADHNERLEHRLAATEVAHEEACRALYTWRNVFDHIGTYVPMDPKLRDLLFAVANEIPMYTRYLSRNLAYLRDPADARVSFVLTPKLQDGERIDRLVRAINDPVFNVLWASRTPSALSEMLRHGLFLAMGYPHAVAQWAGDGVHLELPAMKSPGYTNWGCRTVQSLPKWVDYMWTQWREQSSKRTAPAALS